MSNLLFFTLQHGDERFVPGVNKLLYLALQALHLVFAHPSPFFFSINSFQRIGAMLSHPNLLIVYGAVAEQLQPAIVMQSCAADPLAKVVSRLTFQEKCIALQQVAAAVAFMHRKGITHRDISLETVFVEKGNNVRLGSFGQGKISGLIDQIPEVDTK